MCESNAYIIGKDGSEELLMENVNYLKPDENGIVLRSLFGEEMTVDAAIREVNLTGHKIVLETRS